MAKIIAIVGSPRPTGNTNFLVDIALKEAHSAGVETEKIELAKYKLNGCMGHDNCDSFKVCQQKDDAVWIIERFRQADGIILATPVYYWNMTAQMKTFIDRNYFLFRHRIKRSARSVGVIIVAGGSGIELTEEALRRFIESSTRGPHKCIHKVAAYASRIGDVKSKLALVEEARQLGRTMALELLDQS